MSKWNLSFVAIVLILAAGCGSNVTLEPTVAPTNTPLPAPTATPSPVPPTATVAPNAGDYTPQTSVWNTTIGPDTMSGTCSTGSILPVYGLVQITPAGDTLTWRSQEPAPYTFSRVKMNVYSYSGPTSLNDGMVTM